MIAETAIVVITGGRSTPTTRAQRDALWAWLKRRKVYVLRVGDCPTGVDAEVFADARAMPMGSWSGQRGFAVEQWRADWSAGNHGGPMRNGAMIRGDKTGALSIDCRWTVSVGAADALIHWPGGKGTADCVRQARARGIEVLAIGDLTQ